MVSVASVAALGQRAAAPFHVARRHVVEHERAVGEMALRQSGLDGGLALQQPVQGGVELVLIDLAEIKPRAKAGGGGCRGKCASGGQLGCGFEDRPTRSARTRSRQRLPSGPRIRSRPILRAVPRAAATWPCGKVRDGEGFAPGRDDRAASLGTARAADPRLPPNEAELAFRHRPPHSGSWAPVSLLFTFRLASTPARVPPSCRP